MLSTILDFSEDTIHRSVLPLEVPGFFSMGRCDHDLKTFSESWHNNLLTIIIENTK